MNNMEKARLAKQKLKEAGHKSVRVSVMDRWANDKSSLRKSIDAKCYDCSCGQFEEVRFCTVKTCPLWFVRPYQEKA